MYITSNDTSAKRLFYFSIIAIFCCAFFLHVGEARAASPLQVSVDSHHISRSEQVHLRIAIEGSQQGDIELPELDAFEVFNRGQSSQMQIVNGAVSQTTTYNYVLLPTTTGTLHIGPIKAKIRGKIYQSKAISIKVVAENAAAPTDGNKDIFLETSLDKQSAYINEQIIYTWRLYRRVRITNAEVGLPAFNGFVVHELGKQREYDKIIAGKRYIITELRRALFPQESGNIALPEASVRIEVVQAGKRSHHFGGLFGNVKTKLRTLQSAPLPAITIKALPPAPADFKGLVGQFRLQAQLSKDTLQTGASSTLTLTVSGH
ncbi:MAG TPA: protein BatD, partial [Flavobacteriales bacterium]|nr:protein BatD [Flavobacteriales bacterium]